MSLPPLPMRWDGDHFVPATRFMKQIDAYFVVGEVYTFVEHHERSQASHAHEFAWLNEAWANLPEAAAAQFPTSEHLRKFALIRTGFANRQDFPCGSKAEALRAKAMLAAIDDYAIVTVEGTLVTRWTAKSQSRRAMNKQEFQDSKTAILEYVSSLLGVTPEELTRNAGRAA
jgi:hypothetical protein